MSRTPLALLLAAAGLTVAARPQSPAGFTAAESKALALKEQGDLIAAGKELCAAIEAADLGDPANRALVESLAVQAFSLAHSTGAFASLRGTLQATRNRAADPCLRATLDLLDLEAALEIGDATSIGEATTRLGFLTAWWVIGPFDNERGGGFARAFPPESGIDLDAAYDGKKRPVHWRQLPVAAPPAGIVDCDALFRPNDQVLCYALTLVHSDRDQTVALRVGSDEALKVFCNRVEVLARDVRRTFKHDQDAVAVRLRTGPNLILLKVCEQEGPFRFAARLTRLDGGPAEGVRLSFTAEELRAAAQNPPAGERPMAAEQPDLGARTFYAEALARQPSGPDAFRLAMVFTHRQPDDQTDRRDHALARQAVEAMPDFSSARMLLAHTRRRPVLHAAEREESARRFDYEEILRREPEHVRALHELAAMDLDSVEAAEAAEDRLRVALRHAPDFALARLELARALRARKLDALADREVLRAAESPSGKAAAVCARLAEMYRARRDWPRVAAALRAGPQGEGVAAQIADALLRAGRADEAKEVLARAEQQWPFDRAARLALARLQRAERDLDAAVATFGRWLTICPEDDEAIVELAWAHGLAGRTEQQKELLRTALDLNKNLAKERRYLDFLEAEERPFYEPWRIDGAEVVRNDKGPPEDAAAKNDPVHELLRQTVVRAYRNGTTSEYEHRVVRILNEEGAQQMARQFVPHYHGEQRARLLTARIFKADGSVVRPRLREYYVELPSLAPGDVVDLEHRVDDLAPSYFGDYFGLLHYFARGNPCAHSVLIAVLDPGREYRVQVRNGAPEPERETLPDGVQVWRFELRDLPRTEYEEFQPSWDEVAPLARITTYASWDDFAAWWWNLIRRQMEMTPAMRAKVHELTAHAKTPREKLDAIYRFVTTDVRYTAWEFGVHGYKPYSTPAIFERRHGDCKDKALLLNTMLAEVGIEAWPVLIWAENPHGADDLSLAMVHHFNHCISYVPAQGDLPEMFLDGTATYHPLDTLPEMDHGARVLVVRGGKAELRDVPWADPAANAAFEEMKIALAPTGDARIRLVRRPQGNHAVDVRAELGNEPAKRKEKLERELSRVLGKARVEAVQTSDLLDLGQPVEVVVDLMVDDFAARQDDGLVLVGSLQEDRLSRLVAKPERNLPLLRGTPESRHTVLRYRLPPGFAPASLPEATRLQTRFGTFSQTWSYEGDELKVERALSFVVSRIEPQEYPEFRDFVTAIQRADAQVVVVKGKGGSR